jgi:hypothetical protein
MVEVAAFAATAETVVAVKITVALRLTSSAASAGWPIVAHAAVPTIALTKSRRRIAA